jgi:probable phosphoglycerate mutase
MKCELPRTAYLIRHGESQSNAGLPTSHPKAVPLTKLGEEQAKYIAEYLKSQPPLDLIVTSSYARSKQTAEKTRSSFPHVPLREWPVQEFTFLSLVPKKSSTVDERRPFVEKYWKTWDPLYVHGPGAESFQHFIKRARKVIRRLRNTRNSFLDSAYAALMQPLRQPLKYTKHDTIAVFSHQQFICALLWLSQRDPVKLSPKTMQEFKDFLDANSLPNGAIVRVRFGDSHEPWQCETITSHLEELAAQEKQEELVTPR